MAQIEPREVRLNDNSIAVIRSAEADDAERLAELKRAVVCEGPWTLAQEDELTATVEDYAKSVEQYLEDDGSIYLVVARDGLVLGTVRIEGGCFRRTMHGAELHSLWVDAAYRRLGVADALLEAVLDWAHASERLEKIFALAFSTTTPVLALYRKHGFIEEGRGLRDMKFEDGSYADTVVFGHFLGAED